MNSLKRIKNLLFCLFALTAASCTQNETKRAALRANRDTIELNRVSGPTNFKFTILSVGNDTLKIFKHATSCGCTQVSVSKTNILPGDSAFITGLYTPEVKGPFEKTIVLNLNSKEKFKVLRIRGECDSLTTAATGR
jgi:hypothetical protein